jgi:lysophospholipase L1-like esterase
MLHVDKADGRRLSIFNETSKTSKKYPQALNFNPNPDGYQKVRSRAAWCHI